VNPSFVTKLYVNLSPEISGPLNPAFPSGSESCRQPGNEEWEESDQEQNRDQSRQELPDLFDHLGDRDFGNSRRNIQTIANRRSDQADGQVLLSSENVRLMVL